MVMQRKNRSSQDETKKRKILKDPFLRRQVECPICGYAVEQRGLKTNLFRAELKDVDLRPYSFKWDQNSLSHFHPPFYYIWYCPRCYFAAGRKFFENPLKGCFMPIRKFQKEILERYKKDSRVKRIANKLTEYINVDNFCFVQAFQLHLLAIFWLEEFKEFTERDAMNLARYYIRVAWLFRDMDDDETIKKEQGPDVEKFFTELKEIWEGVVDNETDALRKAAHYYEVTLSKSEIIETAVDELNVLLIVAKVYLKLDDLKPALDALTSAVTSGTRAKQEIDQVLRAPRREGESSLSEKRMKEMRQESSDLRGLIDRTRSLLDRVKEDWFALQHEKAEKILEGITGKSSSKKREILTEAGIEPKIINRLVPVVQEQKKKKGFLANLMGK